jgi:hypothetical protein
MPVGHRHRDKLKQEALSSIFHEILQSSFTTFAAHELMRSKTFSQKCQQTSERNLTHGSQSGVKSFQLKSLIGVWSCTKDIIFHILMTVI